MTRITNKNSVRHKIQTPDIETARARMAFDPGPQKTGVTIEYHMQDLRDDGAPAGNGRVRALQKILRGKHGIATHDHIAGHILTVESDSFSLRDIKKLVTDIARIQKAVMTEALDAGLKPVPFGNMAGLTVERALENVLDATNEAPDRALPARMMMQALRAADAQDMVAYPLLNAQAQVKIGARDPDHMYAMIRRHNALLPFYSTLFHNRPPAYDEQGVKDTTHSGLAQRAALGPRGLIPPHFAHSRDGESYIRNELSALFKRVMYCYADENGTIHPAAPDEKITLETLRDRGLATRANAQLGAMMTYNAAAMGTIPGTPYMQAELRDIDTAGHAAVSIAVVSALMNLDRECGAAVDSLLAGYGLPDAPLAISNTLHLDLKRAQRDAGKHMEVSYAAWKAAGFARDFAYVIEKHADRHGVAADLAPLLHACRTGMTEAKALDGLLHSAEDVARYQREYDPALLADPRRSLALTLKR